MGDNIPKHDPPGNATQSSEVNIQLRNAMCFRRFENTELSEGNATNGASTATQGNYTVSDGYIALDEWVQLKDDSNHIWQVQAVADDEITISETDRCDGGSAISDYTTILSDGLYGFRYEQLMTGSDMILTDPNDRGFTGSDIQVSDTDTTTIATQISSNTTGITSNDTDIEDHEDRLSALEQGDMDSGTSTSTGTKTDGINTYGMITDTTKSWTSGQWTGFVLIDSGGSVNEIIDNNATQVWWEVATVPDAGSYKIRRQAFIEDNSITQSKLVDSTLELTSVKFTASERLSSGQVTILKKITDSDDNPAAAYDFSLFTDMDGAVGEIENARGGYATLGRRLDQISGPTGGLIDHAHDGETGQGGVIPQYTSVYITQKTAAWASGTTVLGDLYMPDNITGVKVFNIQLTIITAATNSDNVFGIRSKDQTTQKAELTLSSNATGQYSQNFTTPTEIGKHDQNEIEIYITTSDANETAIEANLVICYYPTTTAIASPS